MKYKSTVIVTAIVVVLLTLNGCAHDAPSYEQRSESIVEVIIKPDGVLPDDLRLGVFDFIESTQIKGLGSNLAQQAYELLLQERFVHQIGRIDKEVAALEWALDTGQEQGYDLVLVGEVNEFVYGGLSSDSRVSLTLRILDPKANITLWYLTGAMADKPQMFFDYLLFWRTSKEATSPYRLSGVLLEEMIAIINDQRRAGILE